MSPSRFVSLLAVCGLLSQSGCGPGTAPHPGSSIPAQTAGPEDFHRNRDASGSSGAEATALSRFSDTDVAADPERFLALARTMPVSGNRDTAMLKVLTSLAKTDPERARMEWKNWEKPSVRPWIESAKTLAAELGARDPAAMAAFISGDVPRPMQSEIWQGLHSSCGPEAVAPYISLIPEGLNRFQTAAGCLEKWMIQDPPAAAHWLDGFVRGLAPEEVQELKSNSSSSPGPDMEREMRQLENARLTFEASSHPGARALLAEIYLERAVRVVPDQVTDRAAAIEAAVPGISAEIAHVRMHADPAGYAALLDADQIASMPARTLGDLANQWCSKDSRAAAAWLLSHHRLEAMPSTLISWYGVDPPAAVEFAKSLPAGPERDDSMDQLASRAADDGNQTLVEQCLQEIPDPARRGALAVRLEKQMKQRR